MDGWMDQWMHECMGGWKVGLVDRWMEGWVDVCMDV